jgi:hypothetical protein
MLTKTINGITATAEPTGKPDEYEVTILGKVRGTFGKDERGWYTQHLGIGENDLPARATVDTVFTDFLLTYTEEPGLLGYTP